MKNKKIRLSLLLLFSLLIGHPLFAGEAKDSNQHCLRCHGMETLSYRDSTTNAIVHLYVDSVKFKHSNHGDLNCIDCHTNPGFQRYPHSPSVKKEHLYCTNCHESDEFKKFHFKKREEEFKQSVHVQKLGDKFTCFRCHDPHEFKTTFNETNTKEIIIKDNAICLTCHKTGAQLVGLVGKEPYRDLTTVHKWLPNPQLHWKAVRCIECHTPVSGDIYSHQILPKNKAVKKCEECHNKNSILFTKLYRYKAKELQQKEGLFKFANYGAPYVVGMTRNSFVDTLSVILFILLLLGLSAHAIGRWLSTRRNSR